MDVGLIVDFANTETSGADGGLQSWLLKYGLASQDEDLSLEDLVRMGELRAAIQELIAANSAEPASPAAIEALNRIARSAPIRLAASAGGTVALEPLGSSQFERAAAALLSAIYRLMVEGSWGRLKLCRDAACRRAFFDRSKNRSGVWCTMAGCGNRAKARNYRMRRRG